MTTYVLTTTVGKIRLMIGDTDTADAIFTDAEITFFYTEEGSLTGAAAAALEAWAAKYGANADSEKIGDYAFTQKIIENLLKMAKRLRANLDATPAFEISSMDLTTVSPSTEMGE